MLTQYGYPGAEVPVVPVSATGALAGALRWVASVVALLDTVDRYVPDPVRVLDRPFLMSVENVMTISGRGAVVTGEVDHGIVAVGDPVEIVGLGPTRPTVVTSIESSHKTADQAMAGDNTAMHAAWHQARRGRPRPRHRSTRLDHPARPVRGAALRAVHRGRRAAQAVLQRLPAQFFFRTTDVNGTLVLEEGSEMVMPGDTATMTVELGKPIAADVGLGFAVREGGKTVAAGTVTRLLD